MKQLPSTEIKNVKQSRKKSVPGLLQNFSPNPGTCTLNVYKGDKQMSFEVYKFIENKLFYI